MYKLKCFSFLGRQFDRDGNMRQWWTNQTITEYMHRTQCFINQYNNYYIPEIEDHVIHHCCTQKLLPNVSQNNLAKTVFFYVPSTRFQIDGELTLDENIADNGGLREAYYAYKLYIDKNGKEQLLPGLEHYTHEQLLFISYGNVCDSTTHVRFLQKIIDFTAWK